MSSLDVERVQGALSETAHARLLNFDAFSSIDSTNTYLMTQPPPAAGYYRVAIADHQSSGRGRHSRRWVSAPGAGLYLSLAYTFDKQVEQLASLTLAIGVGVLNALLQLGIKGVSLKWPNDIIAADGKLGGILTEVQANSGSGATVVTGIGINLDIAERNDFGGDSDWVHRPIGLSSISDSTPDRETLTSTVIDFLHAALQQFEQHGLAPFLDAWEQYDWLLHREVTVDLADKQLTGTAAGVDTDGALILNTPTGATRIISGSIVLAGRQQDGP